MNTKDINDRINDLEFKLAFQEDVIESLNVVVSAQQQDILLLHEKLKQMAKLVESYRLQQSIADQEVPPHY